MVEESQGDMPTPTPRTERRAKLGEGAQLSHYRLIEHLGEGGFGVVYRAEDVRLGRQVALKLLPSGHALEAKARARFLDEARAISRLEHPNVCLLYEFNEVHDQPFLAMQLVEGVTLEQALLRGALDETRASDVVSAVGAALEAAHARGILHRDVKSDNILLGRDGDIKLADFGVALLARPGGTISSAKDVGTPSTLAPEVIRGERATEASDQFSLAVVTYQCVTGRMPFQGAMVTALFHSIVHDPIEPPTRFGLAPAWDEVLDRALDKDPDRRYASVRHFVEAVREVARGEPWGSSPQTEASQLCLRAKTFYARYTHADNLRALECFEEALSLDPNCVAALTGIADCTGQMRDKGWDSNPAWLDRGMRAAERAVALAPDHVEPFKSKALIQLQRGDTEGAKASLQSALALNPRYVPALVNLAATLRNSGDLAGAEAHLRRALEIDAKEPFVAWALAHVLAFTRRYDETVELCDRFQKNGVSPYFQVRSRTWRAYAYAVSGDRERIEREIREGKATESSRFGLASAEALAAAVDGHMSRAAELIRDLEVEVADHLPLAWILAEAAGFLGDDRAAVRILSAMERKVEMEYAVFRVLPGLARLRKSPLFHDWLGERGLGIVWPLEAPRLSAEDRAQFTSYREASGLVTAEIEPGAK